MALAKTQFHVFAKGEMHIFAAGEAVPEDIVPFISNTEGCLEDDEVFEVDYNTLQLQVLKEIVAGRGLVPTRKKADLIAQLEEDDLANVD